MTDKENRVYCVYRHTLPDGRCYIGATYRGKAKSAGYHFEIEKNKL